MHSIRSPQDITPDWLTGLLQPRYPGTHVESVHRGRIIGGTATKVRLLLEYDAAGHAHRLPPTLWLKAGFEAHSDAGSMQAIYAGEALFYRDIAPLFEPGPPHAYGVLLDPATGQSYLLLEDLLALNARFGHATEPLAPAAAARVLEVLARLHARFWRSRELASFGWLQNGGALGIAGVHEATFTPPLWERCLALPRGRFLRGPLAERERLLAAMRRLLAHDIANAQCLVHGDAQPMNLYFAADGAPGLLDWQLPMWGHWAHDVTEFLVAALAVEDRRRCERELLAHYVDALRGQGVDELDAETAWQEYRRHTLYTIHWALCQPEWQPEEVCLPNTERACSAILDHASHLAWAG